MPRDQQQEGLTMPSEQPPTRVEEAARALDKVIWLTDDVPHEVLVPARELHEALLNEPDEPALAQPQPRGEGDAEKTRGYTREDIQANTWWPGKGGEGDDLAARLEDLASWLEPDSPFHGTIRETAQLARASTHPEQSERVDLEWAFRLMRDCLQAGKEPEDDEQDRLDDIADAMIRPAQTEQGGEGEAS